MALKYPNSTSSKKGSNPGSKAHMATFATSTGLRESSQANSGALLKDKVLSENNDITSPRDSRERTYQMPKKTVHYNYNTGSKEALKHRLALQSPNESEK